MPKITSVFTSTGTVHGCSIKHMEAPATNIEKPMVTRLP